jgi:hypothetical protein
VSTTTEPWFVDHYRQRAGRRHRPPADGPAVIDPATGEAVASHLAEHVRAELQREDARRIARAITAERDWTPVPPLVTLREAIDGAPEPEPSRIERVLPANGRAVLIAAKKTGKSTAVVNVVHAVTTGGQLFGRWRSRKGRVAVLNFELLPEQWAKWCADAGVPLEHSLVLSLRGQANPLATARGRAELAAQLRDSGVDVLVVDPFGAASRGVVENENSNSEVRGFTALLDELAAEGAVSELLLPVHAGKVGEGARGASALEDWPDAIWTLVADESGDRFFRAYGRDIDFPESLLAYNPDTRRLSFSARQVNRKTAAADRAADAIVSYLKANPGAPIGAVREHLAETGHEVGRTGIVGQWLTALVRENRVVQRRGDRNAKLNYLPEDAPSESSVPQSSPVFPPSSGEVCGE